MMDCPLHDHGETIVYPTKGCAKCAEDYRKCEEALEQYLADLEAEEEEQLQILHDHTHNE